MWNFHQYHQQQQGRRSPVAPACHPADSVFICFRSRSHASWKVAGADVGTVERSKKTKHPEFIDIGSLRSGIDVLADVNPSALSPEETAILANALKSKKNLLAVRHKLGLGDVPLLLLYRIDQNKGKDSKYRTKIGSVHDIIGFSIIISGEEVSSDYVKTIHVKTPE